MPDWSWALVAGTYHLILPAFVSICQKIHTRALPNEEKPLALCDETTLALDSPVPHAMSSCGEVPGELLGLESRSEHPPLKLHSPAWV